MQTLPPGSATAHIKRLREQLCEYLPAIAEAKLCFYYLRNAARVFEVELVSREAVMDERQFVETFDDVLKIRYEWLNIGGEGFLCDGRYICSFDCSAARGRPVTLVEVSGPTLRVDGTPRLTSATIVGLLEQIADRFREKGFDDVAGYLLSMYMQRQSGDWNDSRLTQLSREDFQFFERCLRDYIVELSNASAANGKLLVYFGGCLEVLNEMLRSCSLDMRSMATNS